MEVRMIGTIGNKHGGLYTIVFNGKYYWTIKEIGWNTFKWERIPKSVYDALEEFEDMRK